MEINEYLSSGILELYVYGSLQESESIEITRVLKEVPEIKAEVEEIEAALILLSGAAAPYDPEKLLTSIQQKIKDQKLKKSIPVHSRKWQYMSWAANLALIIGMFLLFRENNKLEQSLQALEVENLRMESEIAKTRNDADKTKELLEVFRDRNIFRVDLQGQQITPEAYATVYWNRDENSTYIDAQELPLPPQGMVYQVWSLKFNPLQAENIGLLDKFHQDDNKIFKLPNSNQSEGFGITLEPEGGSETPTLEKLYALGTVNI